MLPVSIDERFRKKRITFGAQPIGQLQSWIFVGRNRGHGIAERRRLECDSRLHILRCGDPAFVKDQIFPPNGGGLATDLTKEGGQRVIIVLAPTFKGMVVTLSALYANAKTQLSHILDLIFRFFDTLVPGHRWIADDGSRCGQ